MGYPIASDVTLSTAAYTKTANLVLNRNQFLGKGRIIVTALASAKGMTATLNVAGTALCDDLPIMQFGATGGLDSTKHVIVNQVILGGVCEFFLRNTTAGALTTDYAVYFEPMK